MTQTSSADQQPDSVQHETLHERMSQSVQTHGFFAAWRAHLPDIARHHRAGGSVAHAPLWRWMQRDPAMRAHIDELTARALTAEVASPSEVAGDSQSHRTFIDRLRHGLRRAAEEFPAVREAGGRPIRCLRAEPFRNWGLTVAHTPALTFLPRTKAGLCNLVRWARAEGKTVRAAGYRHTWSDLYSAPGQVLVSMLPLDVVETLPAPEPDIDAASEFQGIELVGAVVETGVTKALCKIGAGTTNEQFRRWCLAEQGGRWQWTLPLNVVMVEITYGGSNASISHGAGWRNATLSDLVHAIEFVNANGELQIVDDPAQLRCAAGCFGLLGVVTALTLKLDPMTYAVMQPLRKPIGLMIPPPPGAVVPPQIDMRGVTPADLDAAWQEFVRRCEEDYYAEWFWFPYQHDGWINCWKNNGARADAVDYPDARTASHQAMEEYLGELVCATLFKLLPGRVQAELFAANAMATMPVDTTIVTPLIDALHFRRGIQNMRVLSAEFEIPLPPRAGDPARPDWEICRRAWWAVLRNVYGRRDAPMRITLEMRVMAGSNVLMAPQAGNALGTCSIEVLTNLDTPAVEWSAFVQDLLDEWDSYTDAAGNRLNVRPHWAKQWQGLTMRGRPIVEHLKRTAYRDNLAEFGRQMRAIAVAGGYTLAEVRQLFSNPLLDEIFGDVLQGEL